MAENQLMFGLKRQYARTLGLIAVGEDRTDDLAHLAAVIHMFRPDENLSVIKSIRPYRPRRANWLPAALRLLRNADHSMTARELAHEVLAAHHMPRTRANLQRVECSLHAVLARMEGVGIERAGNNPKRWRLTSENGRSCDMIPA